MHKIINILLNSGLEKEAVITTASGQKRIKCVYKNKYQAARYLQLEIDSVNPYLVCAASDLLDVSIKDSVTGLESFTYYVKEIEPRGTDKLILHLSFD